MYSSLYPRNFVTVHEYRLITKTAADAHARESSRRTCGRSSDICVGHDINNNNNNNNFSDCEARVALVITYGV